MPANPEGGEPASERQRPRPSAREALDERSALLYEHLRDLAARSFAREQPGHTLQPTALVHEAWLRLAESDSGTWSDPAQFLGACAHVVREVLIDHARRRRAQKRGGDRLRVLLDEQAAGSVGDDLDLLALDEALTAFAAQYPRAARVVELRFFAGLAGEDAAGVLGVSPRTVDGDWSFARAWLMRALDADGGVRKGAAR
jgi:RNA polymerase sigma factor (TIGR02999 family)